MRLIEASADIAREVPLPDAPRDLAEVVGQGDPQRATGAHGDGGGDRRGDHARAFHGSSREHDVKDGLLRFFRAVDPAMRSALAGRDAPVILACVDHVAAIYREASALERLAPEHAAGSPDGASAEELRDRALPIVQQHHARGVQEALGRFRRHAGSPRTSVAAQEAVSGALAGRVEAIFLTPSAERWGRVIAHDGRVEEHVRPERDDVELLDLAAARTINSGGAAYVLDPAEMPATSDVAVLFRY